MNNDNKFTKERVLTVKKWSENLFSFTITRPTAFRFEAGQFARIGIVDNHAQTDNQYIFRAYSVVSSPYDDELEFFSVVVPDGAFTSQLQHLQVDDDIYLEKIPYGFLTLSRYQQPTPKNLWLVATGTGLAPFLSILQTLEVWSAYSNIVLVYSARTEQELAYQQKIAELHANFATDESSASFHFVPIITREQKSCAVFEKRIPQLLAEQALQQHVGIELKTDNTHIMLCGNPSMVEETKETLKQLGLTMNRRGVGNIAVENYW